MFPKDPRKSTLLAKVKSCSEKGSCGEEIKMTFEYEVLDYAECRIPARRNWVRSVPEH